MNFNPVSTTILKCPMMIKPVGSALAFRGISTSKYLLKQAIYSFHDVKGIVLGKDKLESNKALVDVREPHELNESRIPGAINIPWNSSPEAMSLSKDQFYNKFKFDKPNEDKELVFFCAKGIRATNAAITAEQNGYHKTGIYKGSMADWLANGGNDIK
ncbi:hypothetical protein TPHA_0G00550 [Tetrapisispora phaffii CBS 4417]|uniref:Rhodanese domain-containing protein n=1 Tax=Tetrapisispora phaffii (strain ATCC 24235 / CBS 4417 / NBRC 1672 / NRRL Y-8282 / UCD 70-5) TaxID=1071381 RepID=G8BVG3_TETPH|nr:hypothetical protein TPHA_0G00550 [Tetrapisispora phaffii CBS 4417]CCE63891.1 hypothetical protein TPHA_0G00550 [Tetrapisispora phaffii CBS 4417]